MKEECKLCGCESRLCRSHIIPEFLYEKIYDRSPKRFWYLRMSKDETRKKIEQKGLREYLFCKKCEKKLSGYEKYAAEIIYAKNRKSPVILKNKASNKNITVYQFEKFDFKMFRLFLLSIIWRISISKEKFNTISIADEYETQLHEALKNEDPLEENQFCCFIQLMMKNDDTPFRGTILGPYETSYNDKQVINILLDGFLFSFIIGELTLPQGISEHMLNKEGKMSIVSRYINDDPNIMEAASLMVTNFGDLYK